MPPHTPRRQNVTFVVSTGRPSLIGMAEAAALMARADGQIEDVERRGFLRFLRRHGLLQVFGRLAATQAYNAELIRATPAADALSRLERWRGQPTARLAATAAASTAAADGLAHPAEIALLRQMRARLGLDGDRPYTRFA
jgi:tellurite resistance protein